MSEKQTVVVTAVAYYSSLHAPQTNGKYPSNKYQVELGNLSDEDVEKLKAIGLEGRLQQQATHDGQGNELDLSETKGNFIVPKSQIDNFTIFEGDVETIMEAAKLAKLGNGTKVRAKVDAYTTKYDGSRCVGLNDIIVTEYVAYEGGDAAPVDPAVEDEFTGGKTPAKKASKSDGWDTEEVAA